MIVQVGNCGVELIEHDDGIVNAFKQGKNWEPETRAEWGRLISGSKRIALDIGAYTGVYAIAAAMAGVGVVAFEPHPPNAHRIFENAAANYQDGRVVVVRAAVSDRTGITAMKVPDPESIYDMGTLCRGEGGWAVPTIALDAVAIYNVGLIKLDVEGHEVAALKGMLGLLRRDEPALIVEVLTREARLAVEDEVAATHYTSRLLDGRNLLMYPR